MTSIVDFVDSSDPCPHCLDEGGAVCMMPATSTLQKEDCAYCFCTPAHGTGLFICMCCHESVCEEHIPKHRTTHKDQAGSHCLYTKMSRLPPRLTDEEGVVNVTSEPPAYDYRVVCVDCNQCFHTAVSSPDTGDIGQQIGGEFETTFGLVNAALRVIVHTASVASSDAVSDTSYIAHYNDCIPRPNKKGKMPSDTSGTGEYSDFLVAPPDYKAICDVGEDGKSTLKPAFGANALTGMHNFGNTCYLASAMQVLISTSPDFRRAFLDGGHIAGCTSKAPRDCFICQLEKFATAVYSDRFSKDPSQFGDAYDASRGLSAQSVAAQQEAVKRFESGGAGGDTTVNRPRQSKLPASVVNGITPRDLKRVLANGRDNYLSTTQQDVHQFIAHVLALSRAVVAVNCKGGVDPSRSTRIEMVERNYCFMEDYDDDGEEFPCKGASYQRTMADTFELGKAMDGLKIRFPPNRECGAPLPRPRVELSDVIKEVAKTGLCCAECSECGWPEGLNRTYGTANLPEIFIFDVDRYYRDVKAGGNVKVNLQVVPPTTMDLSHLKIPNTLQEGERPQKEHSDVIRGIPDDVYLTASESLLKLYKTGTELPKAIWALKKSNGDYKEAENILYKRHSAEWEGRGDGLEEIDEVVNPIDAPVLSDVVGGCPRKSIMPSSEEDSNDSEVVEDSQDKALRSENVVGGPNGVTYRLVAIITHVGTSPTNGHYVCHIRKPKSTVTSDACNGGEGDDDGDDHCWVSYNDEKVGVTTKPPFDYASLYFYSRAA